MEEGVQHQILQNLYEEQKEESPVAQNNLQSDNILNLLKEVENQEDE